MDNKRANYLMAAIMFLLSLIMLFPFFLMVMTSLKTMGEVQSTTFTLFPKHLMFINYMEAMAHGDWGRYFFNSFFVTAVTVGISLIINSMAGFAFARLHFRGRDTLFVIALIGMMVPPQVTMIPLFIILKNFPLVGGNDILGQGGMGFVNTYMGMILPYIAGAFGVFLFRQFYLNFPSSLDDAAAIDGLNKFQTFIKIYVPLGKPIFATLTVFKATSTWCEYAWPLVITNNDVMKTVQLALTVFKDESTIVWNQMMAATTLTTLPLIIVFILAQRYFVEGIVTTGMKQ
jgi:multiple sugar transport system permease protein